MSNRSEFLIGGRNTLDENGNYIGGMTMAEMQAYKARGFKHAAASLAVYETVAQAHIDELSVQAMPDIEG